jgi:PKD repeat protein
VTFKKDGIQFELQNINPKPNKMKRILYISLILSLSLFSCRQTPRAHFSTDTAEPEVGQDVYFDNGSENADKYEWDFGDGYISNEVNPVHVFTASGPCDVTLTATSNSGLSDKAVMTINVMIPTLLEIEVLEYWHEYVVPNASVRLYPTLPDWEGETNMESEGYTDEDGVAVFSNLGPYVYYVDVWEKSHDNYQLKTEDIAYIRTDEILPHKINRFTAWVDSVDHGKGMLRGERNLYVKDIVRKASDKPQPVSGNEGWKTLYEKSVRVK